MNYQEAVSRCWLEVDLDAIRENYRSARRILGDRMFAIPVLKANAYGMNALETARALKREGAELFAVATASEAEQIVDSLEGVRVLTMGIVGQDAAKRLIEKGQPLTMFNAESGRLISDAAAAVGKKAVVHIKIDTGLHRIGFEPENAAEEILRIVEKGNIEVEGLYTHLAIHSAEMDHIQMEKLEMVRCQLEEAGIHVPIVHAMDSIGMVRYSGDCRNLNACRIGAWLYGVEPRGDVGEHCLCPARFCARVSRVFKVEKGGLVGYDDDHPLERDSILAAVSAGYIDGTPRIGRDWYVEIRGKRAPVVGISCMDHLMCDVTDIADVAEGDIVTFCGGMIGIEEYAKMGGFNHNEAWARIGRRVPRVFYENGSASYVESEM